MKNHYLVFTKDEQETFIGFTTVEPPHYSKIMYDYLKVSESAYNEAISYFENGKILQLNHDRTYFVAVNK